MLSVFWKFYLATAPASAPAAALVAAPAAAPAMLLLLLLRRISGDALPSHSQGSVGMPCPLLTRGECRLVESHGTFVSETCTFGAHLLAKVAHCP